MNRYGALLLGVLLAVALAACGSDEDASPSTTGLVVTTTAAPETTTTAAPETTTTAAPETTTTAAPETTTTGGSLGETVFGWVRSFVGTDGTTVVGVDEAEMLTGEEAVDAAREDGVIGEDEDLPNDYYIRNPDESTTDYTLSPTAMVTLQACYPAGECVTTEQVDVETWSVLLGGEDDPGLEWDWYGAGSLPYEFTVEDGEIVAVEEVYLP